MEKLKEQGCLWWALIGWWIAPILLIVWGIKTLAEKMAKTEAPEEPEPPTRGQRTATPRPDNRTRTHKVAGTSYRQDAIRSLGFVNPDYNLNKRELVNRWPEGVTVYEYTFDPQWVHLVPEPDNPHDPKAIKVIIDGVHVGYIKSGSCAHIHRLLREKRIEAIEPYIVGGKYKALYCFDEYDRRARRVEGYDLEKDEITIGVRLEITELPEK